MDMLPLFREGPSPGLTTATVTACDTDEFFPPWWSPL
jgi:hypothetical protein